MWKATGMTSYDVIREFKRANKPDYRVGHGGTLDPFAEGVLLLLLGKATKKMNDLMELPKTYLATAVLGARSDTLDTTGEIRNQKSEIRNISLKKIGEVAKEFVGEIEQEIPAFSAAKVKGVPRYKLARRGVEQERKTKKVTIYELEIRKLELDKVTFEAKVSSGTYIRQLSYDVFGSLGIESYLESLVRVRIGEWAREDCVQLADFTTEGWRDRVVQL